jgi:hypothetical protein
MADDSFFIGWSRQVPRDLLRFYAVTACLVLVAFVSLGFVTGRQLDDPARNLFATSGGAQARPDGWQGDQHFTGVLTYRPYPVLHASAKAGGPIERSLILSGSGKRGATVPTTDRRVEAVGGLVKRGDIDMLVMDDDALTQADTTEKAPVAQPLGRWRAVGEICDGKCYPGGMTPGGGLAHRACATLCVIGEVPAVFVLASPVAGASFLLLAGPDGGLPPESLRDLIARPVELEGDVEKLGAMFIFRVDPAKARVL